MCGILRWSVTLATLLFAGWAIGAGLRASTGEAKGATVAAGIGSGQEQSARWPTLREVLAANVGDRLPEYEARATAESRSLDGLVDPASLPAWNTIVDEVAQEILAPEAPDKRFRRWLNWADDQQTSDVDFRQPLFNPSGKELTKEDLVLVHRVAEEYDNQILDLAEEEGVRLEEAFRGRIARGGIQHAPFFLAPSARQDRRRVVFERSLFHKNWAVTVTLREGDSPAYDEITRRLVTVRAERLQAVREKITELSERR